MDIAETRKKAEYLLNMRFYTEKELRGKLSQKGALVDDINTIIEEFSQSGLIDDERYARLYTEEAAKYKHKSARKIEFELRNKGIEPDFIKSAMSELEHDESDDIYAFAIKKLNGDYSFKSFDRAFRYLAGKGYDFSDIKSALDRIKSEQNEDV